MSDDVASLPPLPSYLRDPAQLQRYQRAIVAKMGEVNRELSRLLESEDGSLATMKIPGLGGGSDDEDPVDRLRKYLEFLKERLRHIIDDDGMYGRCVHCGEPLTKPELDQMPWADTCRACAAKGLG